MIARADLGRAVRRLPRLAELAPVAADGAVPTGPRGMRYAPGQSCHWHPCRHLRVISVREHSAN